MSGMGWVRNDVVRADDIKETIFSERLNLYIC
jgi:hypothetical protein